MTRRFFRYIFSLLGIALLLAACTDNQLTGDGSGEMREFRGTVTLDLSMPDVAIRTRTVNTEAGAALAVNNLWVGIFDVATGECFGVKRDDNFGQTLQSGVLAQNILTVDFVSKTENLPLAYIVAVANYDGVKTWEGELLTNLLPDSYTDIDWDKLINIGIDTASAYAGDKGEKERSDAPFMVGFFQDAVSLTQNPKIDQFAYTAPGPATIYPASAANGMDIALGDASDDKIYVAAGAICLRRLVSHNTVRLQMSNGYSVTAAKYKRFNMPRAVFMLQRRTDVNRYDSFEEWRRHSPNYADRLLTEEHNDASAENFPYACDKEWIPVEVYPWDDSGSAEFTFDHFENKHWGAAGLKTQADREARNPDGSFAALCSGNGQNYNDFASYFVLSMHVVNKNTGESADVEYTLHEGYCNDDDGHRTDSQEVRCRDFTSVRNVHYTYNINISGLRDITANATAQDGAGHTNGQSGNVWKMNYATGPSKSPIPVGGGTYDNCITFSSNPDLGFRILGRGNNGQQVDVCYNMPDGMLEGFAGLWPSGEPVIAERLEDADIPSSLLNSMKIGSGSQFYTLTDFVALVQNGTIPTGQFSISFDAYNDNVGGLTGSLMRAIYIFDRNDTHNAVDEDLCSGYHLAYGAEQYPFEPQKIRFDEKNILWDNTYYKLVAKVQNVYAASTPIFYGAECSVIDLRWKHDPRFVGYKISVFNDSYTHPTIVVGPSTLDRYLRRVGNDDVFIYPLSTADFPRSTGTGANNYNFSVTPIIDDDIYTVDGPTVVMRDTAIDATCIRVCPTMWETAKTKDWVNIQLANHKGGVDIHYRGLQAFCTSDIGSNYNNQSYICFGLGGSTINCYFSFWASVPGKFSVTAKSHSTTDPNRPVIIVRMDESGPEVNGNGEHYETIYNSQTITTSSTTPSTYTSDVVYLNNGQPTEFRIYSSASIDYYKFEFTPSK